MTGGPEIRVVLVDDHAIVREGLRRVFERDHDFEVVGEAGSAEAALELLRSVSCDVVLLDVSMPGRSGLTVMPELASLERPPRALVLSMHDRPAYVVEAMRAGASGYVLKDMEPKKLRDAVRTVASGSSYFPLSITERVGRELKAESDRDAARRKLDGLTPREREVLREITTGATNGEIAERLGIGRRTVESHREHLMDKLDIHTVAELTRFAIECGLG